jgi:hypothetical protein
MGTANTGNAALKKPAAAQVYLHARISETPLFEPTRDNGCSL